MRILSSLTVALILLAAPPVLGAQAAQAEPAAAEQTAAPATTPAATPAADPTATQAPAQQTFGSGPIGANQPRTLRHLWHLFAAYALIWVLVFGYALSIGRRFGRLEAEVRQLAER